MRLAHGPVGARGPGYANPKAAVRPAWPRSRPLMYTHMPRGLNKVTAVSLWQFRRSAHPEIPFWDNVLGYWRASLECPEQVLFLRYEELLRDPAENVRRLARFVGAPFSEAEDEAGVVRSIVELCSLGSLRNVEANRTGLMEGLGFPRKALFRKGVAGDWANHMTPEMARCMDEVVADKLRGTGLTFQ